MIQLSDTIIGLDRDDLLPTMPRAAREQWQAWLRHHGVDADDVAVPGMIERRPDARQVAYIAYELDENGRPVLGPNHQTLTVVRIVQLEAAPSPFPAAHSGQQPDNDRIDEATR